MRPSTIRAGPLWTIQSSQDKLAKPELCKGCTRLSVRRDHQPFTRSTTVKPTQCQWLAQAAATVFIHSLTHSLSKICDVLLLPDSVQELLDRNHYKKTPRGIESVGNPNLEQRTAWLVGLGLQVKYTKYNNILWTALVPFHSKAHSCFMCVCAGVGGEGGGCLTNR